MYVDAHVNPIIQSADTGLNLINNAGNIYDATGKLLQNGINTQNAVQYVNDLLKKKSTIK